MIPLSNHQATTKSVSSTAEEALRVARDRISMLTDREQKVLKKRTVESHGDKSIKDLQVYQKNIATIITELL